MNNVKKPHKHAEVMKAYAEDCSLVIECQLHEGAIWEVVTPPSFFHSYSYRVKPELEYPKSTLTKYAAWNTYQRARGTCITEGMSVLTVADEAVKEFITSGEMVKYFMNPANGYVNKDNT